MIYHLEMCDQQAFRPKAGPPGFHVTSVDPPRAELNRSFYQSVGAAWQWTDRLPWSESQWQRYVRRDVLQTWIGKLDDQPVGYFELESEPDGNVEVVYFGLLPEFIGRGLGGAMLSAAVQRAWEIPHTRRVWLHTCTEDHQHALANYLKRGFVVYHTERS